MELKTCFCRVAGLATMVALDITCTLSTPRHLSQDHRCGPLVAAIAELRHTIARTATLGVLLPERAPAVPHQGLVSTLSQQHCCIKGIRAMHHHFFTREGLEPLRKYMKCELVPECLATQLHLELPKQGDELLHRAGLAQSQ